MDEGNAEMDETTSITDRLQEQEGDIVVEMWDAGDIMQQLDRTFWFGADVPEQLAKLREHLQRTITAIDAYVPVRQQWDAERKKK